MDNVTSFLLEVLSIVDELYLEEEADTSKNNPGRPKVYSDFKMFKVFLLATLKGKRKACEVYRYLRGNPDVCQGCGFSLYTCGELEASGFLFDQDLPSGIDPLPCERTFRRRLSNLDEVVKRQICHLGQYLIEKEQVTDAKIVALDKKMIKAQGPLWHKSDREAGRIPEKLRNVDTDSRWSKSHYRGWVQGYGFHVAVTATPLFPIVPFWADWTFNDQNEAKVALSIVDNIPKSTHTVVGDTGYDDPDLRDAIEIKDSEGNFNRNLIVPIKICPSTPKDRMRYANMYQSENGKTSYHQRKISIEPFYQRLDLLFDIEPAWEIGLTKNRVWGLLWVCMYLILMIYLNRKGKPIEQIKHLLDTL